MTRGLQGRETKNKMPYQLEMKNVESVNLTELYFQPIKLRTMFRLTHRVILSEAAHRV